MINALFEAYRKWFEEGYDGQSEYSTEKYVKEDLGFFDRSMHQNARRLFNNFVSVASERL